MTEDKVKFPLPSLVASGLASLFVLAGVVGLAAPELAPQLARPALAWLSIGVGAVIDLCAVAIIVAASRSRRREAWRPATIRGLLRTAELN